MEVREDGLVNYLTRQGTSEDPSFYTHVDTHVKFLCKQELDALYAEEPECARVVDYLPSRMAKGGIEILVAKDHQKVKGEIIDHVKRNKIIPNFAEAQKLANLYGGSAIVLFVDDGKKHFEPVDLGNIKSVEILSVRDCYEINAPSPQDVQNQDYYTLNFLSQDEQIISPILGKIHKDRILRFDGLSLPKTSLYNYGWGASLLQRFYKPYMAYDQSMKAISAMLQKLEVLVFKIKDLSTKIALGDDNVEAQLYQRLELVKQSFTNLGAAVVDAENEDASYLSRNLQGVDVIVSMLRDRLLVASGLSETALSGKVFMAGGLAGVDMRDRMQIADEIEAKQEQQWRDPLEKYLSYLIASMPIPDGFKWELHFASTLQLTPLELAELKQKQSQVDATEIEYGILSHVEARISRHGNAKWSSEVTLDEVEDPQPLVPTKLSDQDRDEDKA